MAKRITDEMIIQINKEYKLDPVKSHVAKKLGISPATVTKYLRPEYQSIANKQIEVNQTIEKTNFELPDAATIKLGDDWGALCALSDEEWVELKELQKTIFK